MSQYTSSKNVRKTRNAVIRFLTLALIIISAYYALKSTGFFSKTIEQDPVTVTKFQNSLNVSGSRSYQGCTDLNTVSAGNPENNTSNFSSGIIGPRTARTSIIGEGKDEFTIMIYMCGSDLESAEGLASKNIEELMAVKKSDKINIIIQTGGTSEWQNSFVKNNCVERFEVRSGKLKKIASSSIDKMTNYSNLTSFITYCKNAYPADRYALIFWGNGGGTSYGFGYDETDTEINSLTADELNLALYSTGIYFDFVGFDAGYMATYDMAYVMNFYSDYLIASQENMSTGGWNYTNWLNALSENSSLETTEIARIIIDDYKKEASEISEDLCVSLTLIDLVDFNNLVHPAMSDFFSYIDNQMSEGNYAAVSAARSATREFGRPDSDQIDLMDFAAHINSDEGMNLIEALKNCIKYNFTSDNLINANGLTLYFPLNNIEETGNTINILHRINIDREYSGTVRKFANILIGGRAAMLVHSGESDYKNAICRILNVRALTDEYSWIDCDFIENCDAYYLNNSLSESVFNVSGITNNSGEVSEVIEFSKDDMCLITDIRTEGYACLNDGSFVFLGTDSSELTFFNNEKRHLCPSSPDYPITLNNVPVFAKIISYQEFEGEKKALYCVPVTISPALSDENIQQNENAETALYSANLYILCENDSIGNNDVYSIAYIEKTYDNNETKTHSRFAVLNEGDMITPEYYSASVDGNIISLGENLSGTSSVEYGEDTVVSASKPSDEYIAFYVFEDIYGNLFRYRITEDSEN